MHLLRWAGSWLFFFLAFPVTAQEINMPPIPPMRMLYHDQIIASYRQISEVHLSKKAPLKDSFSIISSDRILKNKIDGYRADIERNTSFTDNDRFKWLRSLREFLEGYREMLLTNKIHSNQWAGLVDAYGVAMKATWEGKTYLPIFYPLSIESAWLLLQNTALNSNPGRDDARDWLLLQQAGRDPSMILPLLSKLPQCRYADSLIVRAAFLNQEKLYTYAAVPDALGKKIHQSAHPLVKLIAYLTKLPTGRMIFPFIDEIYHGRLTIDSIAPLTREDTGGTYFRMLIQTRISYMKRLRQGDTAMGIDALYKRIKQKAVEDYLNEINGLHEENNPVKRFRKINRLSPEELYYVAITGEEEMYTSSFVLGIYPRMFQLWKGKSPDSLLARVQYDQYRRFIRLCASYNTLDDWLNRMDSASARKMVVEFTDGLEKTEGLADAVDVATTYSSIYNANIRNWMLTKVDERVEQLKGGKDFRGSAIYTILQKIFYAMDTSRRTSVLDALGLEPADRLTIKSLQDSSGRIIVQQFFYGDKGGPEIHQTFLKRFSNPQWKIVRKPFWTEVSSVKGTPVTIYSNLPLDEVGDKDEHAQDSLITYLMSKKIEPVMSIHRGHSYSLPSTIEKLPFSSQLVLVGSCGGYQRLNDVLETCPQAAIISSKQVGTGQINQLLIDVICEQMRRGVDIYWPTLWKQLETRFTGKSLETFRDYVPPYQNLGALFIQAYRMIRDNSEPERLF